MEKFEYGLSLKGVCDAIDAYRNNEDDVPEAGMITAFKILLADSSHLRELEDKLRIKQNHIRLRDSYIEELEERAEEAEAQRDALAAENKVLDSAIGAIVDAYETGLKDLLAQEIDTAVNTTTPATDAYANQLRAEGAASVGTLIRACVHEFPDSAEDIVEECAMIADNRAINLCKENGNG